MALWRTRSPLTNAYKGFTHEMHTWDAYLERTHETHTFQKYTEAFQVAWGENKTKTWS